MSRNNPNPNTGKIITVTNSKGNNTMQFSEVAERPTITRNRAKSENPFVEVVAGIAETEKTLQFELPFTNEADEKDLRIKLRLLTEAGNEVNVTVRRLVEFKDGEKPSKGNVAKVTFWTVAKIKQNRKQK